MQILNPAAVKILVVTDAYPPHHVGGYELGCRDVAEKLSQRGHDVQVLTSTFRTHQNFASETNIERALQFNISPTDPRHDKRAEMRLFQNALLRFAPDVASRHWRSTPQRVQT